MEAEISSVVLVRLLIPLVGLLSGVFWQFTGDPRDEFGYLVEQKFQDKLQEETNKLGDLALQVANLAETDDDRVDIAVDHAVAIVMRGAFDDSLPNAEEIFSAVDPDVASQQQSVRSKIKAFNRGQRLYTVCVWAQLVWKVVVALLVGLFLLTVVVYGIPVLYPQTNLSFTGSGAVGLLSVVSIVLCIVAYLTGTAWVAADHKLKSLLHKHDIESDPDPGAPTTTQSGSSESPPPIET